MGTDDTGYCLTAGCPDRIQGRRMEDFSMRLPWILGNGRSGVRFRRFDRGIACDWPVTGRKIFMEISHRIWYTIHKGGYMI